MPRTLDPELRSALAARIRFYNEMGIYDFYRRPLSDAGEPVAVTLAVNELRKPGASTAGARAFVDDAQEARR